MYCNPGYGDQFDKIHPSRNWLINGFDPNSIMMYGELEFSRDGYLRTMEHKGGQKLIQTYQKNGLTYSDVQRINTLYGC